jgi:hypothetical protein
MYCVLLSPYSYVYAICGPYIVYIRKLEYELVPHHHHTPKEKEEEKRDPTPSPKTKKTYQKVRCTLA